MRSIAIVSMALTCLLAGAADADLLSKSYEFRTAAALEIGLVTGDGVRLDTVRFELPSQEGRAGASAEVALSNTTGETRRLGVAIALFDADGRLVGVASGGSRWLPLKEGRARSYKVVFDDVNAFIHQAKSFQISIETWK